MDRPFSVTLSAYLKQRPTLIWLLLLLAIGANMLLSHWLNGVEEILLICIGFLLKGVLVVNYLMGLHDAPRWIRWPMQAYFIVFSVLFFVSFSV
ncbi:MAG: hypothetical protein R3208_01695 [Ketobacteraceae bacterium]|nr:hypothetical protein [Ketobacteraceae bacterium]